MKGGALAAAGSQQEQQQSQQAGLSSISSSRIRRSRSVAVLAPAEGHSCMLGGVGGVLCVSVCSKTAVSVTKSSLPPPLSYCMTAEEGSYVPTHSKLITAVKQHCSGRSQAANVLYGSSGGVKSSGGLMCVYVHCCSSCARLPLQPMQARAFSSARSSPSRLTSRPRSSQVWCDVCVCVQQQQQQHTYSYAIIHSRQAGWPLAGPSKQWFGEAVHLLASCCLTLSVCVHVV